MVETSAVPNGGPTAQAQRDAIGVLYGEVAQAAEAGAMAARDNAAAAAAAVPNMATPGTHSERQ